MSSKSGLGEIGQTKLEPKSFIGKKACEYLQNCCINKTQMYPPDIVVNIR